MTDKTGKTGTTVDLTFGELSRAYRDTVSGAGADSQAARILRRILERREQQDQETMSKRRAVELEDDAEKPDSPSRNYPFVLLAPELKQFAGTMVIPKCCLTTRIDLVEPNP